MKSLLVEDNPADVRLIQEMLKHSPAGTFQFHHVGRLDAALERLRQEAFDVILLDLGLPDSQGMDTLSRTQKAWGHMPIVVLTGLDDQAFASGAVRAGAQDYLVKGRLDGEQLVRTICYAVERKRAQEEIRRLNQTLEQRVRERTGQLEAANTQLQAEIAVRAATEEALEESEAQYRLLFDSNPMPMWVFDEETMAFLAVNDATLNHYGYTRKEFMAMTIKDIRPPGEVTAILAAVKQQNGMRAGLAGEWQHRKKDGTLITVEVTVSSIRFGDRPGRLVAANDITERKRMEEAVERANAELEAVNEKLRLANETLEKRVQERTAELKSRNENLHQVNRALQVLTACNETLVRAQTEPELLNEICRVIVEDVGYRMTWVGFAEQDRTKTVRPAAWTGIEEGYLRQARVRWADAPRGRGPTGTAIRTGKPVVCRDILNDPRLAPWRDLAVRNGYASSVSLPLIAENRTLGALTIYSAETDAFNDQEVRLLTELGDNMAYGLTTLRGREERKRLENTILEISEREQRRMGQDLHDGICQVLLGLACKAEVLEKKLHAKKCGEAAGAAELAALAHKTIGDTREVARGLTPVATEREGLMSALTELAHRSKRLFNVPCHFHCPEPVLISDNTVANNLYRIAQEAVQNAVAHGKGKRIVVELKRSGSEITLAVRDDGIGFDPSAVDPRAGMGMGIMRYRAQQIGASIEVRSEPGKGASVICTVAAKEDQTEEA